MVISVAALVAALLPLLFGGKLSRLSAVSFRHVTWIVAALLVQILIIEILPGPRVLLQIAHVATYVIAAWFVIANRRVRGLWLIGAGAALNGLAIALNGGTLPARPEALRTAGIRLADDQFVNSGVLAHPRLAFLGDVFAIPAGLPLANVFSVGDVLIVLGAGWTAWVLLGARWTKPWIAGHVQRDGAAADGAAGAFGREPLGYRRRRVDDHLSRQHEQMSALRARLADTERELGLAREELDRALQELGSRGRPEYLGERLSEILRLATEEGEQELGAARDAAATILEGARSQADRVAAEAAAQAEQIMALHQQRLNAVLGAYHETVRRLDAAKDLLGRFLAEELSTGNPAHAVDSQALPAMTPP